MTAKDSLEFKRLIWAYFLLIIFEGALRKWFLTGLATPLLLVRDPIAIWLVFKSVKKRLLSFNNYVFVVASIGIVAVFTSLIFGHGNIIVALYGARVLLFHFPLIFIIGKVFDIEDVKQIGTIMLYISIPMAILIALQFYSAPTAWVNKGVGGEGTAGFSGAEGYLRPPGTFSFTNGNTAFFSFLSLYIVYFWLNPNKINKAILIGATGALIIAIPLSISRSLLLQTLLSLVFAILASSRKPKYLARMMGAIVGGMIIIMVLSQTPVFSKAMAAFTSRFESANEAEGGLQSVLVDRYLGGLIGALVLQEKQSLFGYGLGMGSNVGSILLSGQQQFLIAEGEWGRIVGEMGPLLGLIIIAVRIVLTGSLTIKSYKRLSTGEILPWMLLSFGIIEVSQAQWSQPTSLGFSILLGGLLVASLNNRKIKTEIVETIPYANYSNR